MGKKSIFVAHTQKVIARSPWVMLACSVTQGKKKKITVLLTKVPQIIHFVICKVQQINSHIESVLYCMDLLKMCTDTLEKVSWQVYIIYIWSNFGFVYTILQKLGM